MSTIEEAKGIGLFAENVFLNGTLSTQVDAQSYAGVNTLDGAQFTKIEEPDGQSKIVFWAGAKDNSNPAIQDAPF